MIETESNELTNIHIGHNKISTGSSKKGWRDDLATSEEKGGEGKEREKYEVA